MPSRRAFCDIIAGGVSNFLDGKKGSRGTVLGSILPPPGWKSWETKVWLLAFIIDGFLPARFEVQCWKSKKKKSLRGLRKKERTRI